MEFTSNNKIIISIEGNIGVGKSTFISIIEKFWEDCKIVDEPVDIWKKLVGSDGKNILETFYSDKERWSYSFQNVACITRMIKQEEILNNCTNKYIFLDRSLGTDKNVFEKMLYDSKMISELEHSMYNVWYDFYWKYVRDINIYKPIHIYLKCTPEICLQRIKKRNRIEEKNINLEYLEDLNKYHDIWLNSDNKYAIIINCNEDFENNLEKQHEMINLIKQKIKEIII